MSIQQIPPRPNPTDYASYSFLNWLDNLRNRVFQLINGVGTSTNDNAAAGSIGEFISSTVLVGSEVPLTVSGTAYDVTSISLTAGDWDVWGNVAIHPAAGTIPTSILGWISTTSATGPTRPNAGAFSELSVTLPASTTQVFTVGSTRLSLASTTTVYLSTASIFTVSTCGAYGYIAARRRR